jgi:AraC family transcriptional regulator
MWDVRCGLGPADRPFPERHSDWCIAVVRRGTFAYRAYDTRRPTELRADWLLLGREGAEFECSHPRCTGDDCASIDIAPALVEDVRSATRLGGRTLFPASVLPPIPRVSGELAAIERELRAGGTVDLDAHALAVVEAVLAACGARPARHREPSRADRERVAAALDAIDGRPEEPWPLGELAALVGASPFHFARAFRAIVGTTPHRYVVSARLRRAATLLLDTQLQVTQVAYEVGFGDLSNFVHTFHREMGAAPREFRTCAGTAATRPYRRLRAAR